MLDMCDWVAVWNSVAVQCQSLLVCSSVLCGWLLDDCTTTQLKHVVKFLLCHMKTVGNKMATSS